MGLVSLQGQEGMWKSSINVTVDSFIALALYVRFVKAMVMHVM